MILKFKTQEEIPNADNKLEMTFIDEVNDTLVDVRLEWSVNGDNPGKTQLTLVTDQELMTVERSGSKGVVLTFEGD